MFTWIDLVIILIVLLYGYAGYGQGFLKMFFDILGIAVSFILALKYYNVAAVFFTAWGLNPNLARPIGFFALWTIVQIIFWLLSVLIFHYISKSIDEGKFMRILGILPGLLKGILIVAIFLIIILILPFSNNTKALLSKSDVSGYLIRQTAQAESQMAVVLGQLNSTLTFIGTAPESDGITQLNFKTSDFSIDQQKEDEMLQLVNKEREKAGLQPLVMDNLIRNVARAHSMDMVQKGYFAHEDPSGLSPYERLVLAKVNFKIAGENLALAPTIDLAQIGLMNSPTHRANILDPEYGRVGIGVIDAGPYGLMITQDFAD